MYHVAFEFLMTHKSVKDNSSGSYFSVPIIHCSSKKIDSHEKFGHGKNSTEMEGSIFMAKDEIACLESFIECDLLTLHKCCFTQQFFFLKKYHIHHQHQHQHLNRNIN